MNLDRHLNNTGDAQVSVGDATKTLASRIWENWIPFGTETAESEIAVVANARVPLADIFTAGMPRTSLFEEAKECKFELLHDVLAVA